MAKRRRKLKDKKALISKKKIRRWLFRLFLIALGGAVGILARPSLLPDPSQRAQVEDLREQILQANDEAQLKAMEVLSASSQNLKQGVDTVSDITKEVTHTDPQALVQDKVATLKQEVQTLPEKQLKKVKLEFCQDVIEEVKLSCEADTSQ